MQVVAETTDGFEVADVVVEHAVDSPTPGFGVSSTVRL
jgi:hypothetical protein